MTPRVERLLARARRRRGGFWLRRRYAAESFAKTEGEPVVLRQAKVLDNILRKMPVTIVPSELIVGYHPESPSPADPPSWSSFYPRDLKMHTAERRAAMEAGVFCSGAKTGHLTPAFDRLLSDGLDRTLSLVEQHWPDTTKDQKIQREAMAITLRAASHFIERYARAAASTAGRENDPARKQELLTISTACQRVAHHPARNVREALQLVWFAFLIECIEEGEGTAAFALGRFDQYIGPYWQADIASGADREKLKELVGSFWVKLNEFNGLQVLNLTIGGSDRNGRDAVNDLSVACLEIMDEFRTPTPSLSVRWHPKIDRKFFRKAVELSTHGFGQPAIYSDPAAIKAMVNAKVDPGDATDVVPGGCVELGIQGSCYPWVGNFFNLPKCLELALHDGIDPQTGKQLGPKTGKLAKLDTFDKLFAAYDAQVSYMLDMMSESENAVDRFAGMYCPYPFLSSIVDDCISNGLDITRGGARYNFTELQGIGVAHVIDSLLNIRRLVYEDAGMTLQKLVAKLDASFKNDEPLRLRLERMKPAYGDHTQESSEMARKVVHEFFDRVERYTGPRGGDFRPGLLVWTLYDAWANSVGALPDGRRRGDAMVSSIGPRGEAPIETPTSIIQDVTSFDHFRCTGGLTMNLRFDRGSVKTEDGLKALENLIEVYFDRGGMQLQLNVVDSSVLKQAQENPNAHANLVVRVSGFCTRFVELSRLMQNEIIARAELDAT